MAGPQWYTKQGADGKWYKTQASSPEEAKTKFAKITGGGASRSAAPEGPSFGDTLGREVSSLGSSITGFPSAVYHAAADPETPEESQRYGKGFESKIGPTGRLIDRMAAQPVMNAAEWYTKALRGKIPNPVEQMLSVAPEAMGIGASGPLLDRAGQRVSKAAMPGALDPTVAGPLRGSMTRGKALLDRVDAAAKDLPVNYKPAYEWAKKAMALEPHGYTVPKPISDFVKWVDSHRPGLERIGSKEFIDRGGVTHPLPYQDARNFEQALGAKIPWDADPGGRMNGIMKKMRESLGQETAAALKPHGLDVPYLKGKAEFTKAHSWDTKGKMLGRIGGKVAGYGTGGAVGHPLILGYAGGKLGESAAGSMVDSVINAGGEK